MKSLRTGGERSYLSKTMIFKVSSTNIDAKNASVPCAGSKSGAHPSILFFFLLETFQSNLRGRGRGQNCLSQCQWFYLHNSEHMTYDRQAAFIFIITLRRAGQDQGLLSDLILRFLHCGRGGLREKRDEAKLLNLLNLADSLEGGDSGAQSV